MHKEGTPTLKAEFDKMKAQDRQNLITGRLDSAKKCLGDGGTAGQLSHADQLKILQNNEHELKRLALVAMDNTPYLDQMKEGLILTYFLQPVFFKSIDEDIKTTVEQYTKLKGDIAFKKNIDEMTGAASFTESYASYAKLTQILGDFTLWMHDKRVVASDSEVSDAECEEFKTKFTTMYNSYVNVPGSRREAMKIDSNRETFQRGYFSMYNMVVNQERPSAGFLKQMQYFFISDVQIIAYMQLGRSATIVSGDDKVSDVVKWLLMVMCGKNPSWKRLVVKLNDFQSTLVRESAYIDAQYTDLKGEAEKAGRELTRITTLIGNPPELQVFCKMKYDQMNLTSEQLNQDLAFLRKLANASDCGAFVTYINRFRDILYYTDWFDVPQNVKFESLLQYVGLVQTMIV
jgi:hypothetical protein